MLLEQLWVLFWYLARLYCTFVSMLFAGSGASFVESHAVQVIGYDNEGEYWLAKNSWGSGFASGGFFKVGFYAASMCAEAVGLVFNSYNPLPMPKGQFYPSSKRPGCYEYRATSRDYVSRVAYMFSTAPQQVLLGNQDVITDEPDMSLDGRVLVLCGLGSVPPLAQLKPSSGGSSKTAGMSQLDALLAIKRAIDPSGVLKAWTPPSGANGGYCKWEGIKCDGSKNVLEVFPSGDLKGSLPDVHALQALPELWNLNLGGNGLQGTLPADWGGLSKLRSLSLRFNDLSGTLPAHWSGMKSMVNIELSINAFLGRLPPEWGVLNRVQKLYLLKNQLSGVLPVSWSGMNSMLDMRIFNNALTGSLPPQWGALSKMQELWLHHNELSGSLPASWSAMKSMVVLDISANKLSGPLPPQWSTFANIKVLWLWGNQLSDRLPGSWGTMNKLEELILHTNRLSGTVPAAQWKGMRRMTWLALRNNKQLSGCLPAVWKGTINMQGKEDDYGYKWIARDAWGPDSDTKVTGFCT